MAVVRVGRAVPVVGVAGVHAPATQLGSDRLSSMRGLLRAAVLPHSLLLERHVLVAEARDIHIDEISRDLPVVAQVQVHVGARADDRPPVALVTEPHVVVLARLRVRRAEERAEGRRESDAMPAAR